MKFCLIVANGKHQGMIIEIREDLFVLGSGKMCQLRSKLAGVQPQHCALVIREGRRVFVRDLANGKTELNGELLQPGEEWPLHGGDRLSIGPLEFVIQLREKPLSQKDAEEWALKCLDQDAKKEERELPEEDITAYGLPRKTATAAQAASAILDQLQAMRGIIKGRLRIAEIKDVTVVRFNDPYLVDPAEISLIKSELLTNLNRYNLRVLLDFKNVYRMSTLAMSMIRDVALKLRSQACSLAICRVRSDLLKMLEALDALKNVPVYRDKKTPLSERW